MEKQWKLLQIKEFFCYGNDGLRIHWPSDQTDDRSGRKVQPEENFKMRFCLLHCALESLFLDCSVRVG